MYQGVPVCIGVYRRVSVCINVYRGVSTCFGVYRHVSACIRVYCVYCAPGTWLIPQSMTTAPSFSHSPRTISARPAPTTRMSARPTWTQEVHSCSEEVPRVCVGVAEVTCSGRSGVFEWQVVTVAWFHSSRSCIGAPTILLRPITTACFPARDTPTQQDTALSLNKA